MVLVWWDLLVRELGNPDCEPKGRLVEVLRQQGITHALVPKSDVKIEQTIQSRMVKISPAGIAWNSNEDVVTALKDGVGLEYDRVEAVSLVAGPPNLGIHIRDFLAPGSNLIPELDRVVAVELQQTMPGVMRLNVERVIYS